jgi:hypothetical protein
MQDFYNKDKKKKAHTPKIVKKKKNQTPYESIIETHFFFSPYRFILQYDQTKNENGTWENHRNILN